MYITPSSNSGQCATEPQNKTSSYFQLKYNNQSETYIYTPFPWEIPGIQSKGPKKNQVSNSFWKPEGRANCILGRGNHFREQMFRGHSRRQVRSRKCKSLVSHQMEYFWKERPSYWSMWHRQISLGVSQTTWSCGWRALSTITRLNCIHKETNTTHAEMGHLYKYDKYMVCWAMPVTTHATAFWTNCWFHVAFKGSSM